jgi:hypothetical protein
MSKLISKLPEDVRVVALQRKIYNCDELNGAFNWSDTPEKYDIWQEVNNGNYAPFREFHAKKQPKNNGWISVEDRLPENENIVIVFNKNEVTLSCYHTENWYTYDNDIINPTHWQPLPSPPAKN